MKTRKEVTTQPSLSPDDPNKDNLDALEQAWDRELAKGDDEFYESFKGLDNRNQSETKVQKTKRRKGRSI